MRKFYSLFLITALIMLYSGYLCAGETFIVNFNNVKSGIDSELLDDTAELDANMARGNPTRVKAGGNHKSWNVTAGIGSGKALISTGRAMVYTRDKNLPEAGTVEFFWKPSTDYRTSSSYFFEITDSQNLNANNANSRGAVTLFFNARNAVLTLIHRDQNKKANATGINLSGMNLEPGRWYHVALTYSHSGMQLHFNGKSSAPVKLNFNLDGAAPNMAFFASQNPKARYGVMGAVDSLRISDDVLYKGAKNSSYAIPSHEFGASENDVNALPANGAVLYPVDKITREDSRNIAKSTQKANSASLKTIELTSKFITVFINEENGCLEKITARKKDLICAVRDNRFSQKRQSENILSAESEDRIIEIKKENKCIKLSCINSSLPGISISKEYILAGPVLRKKVTFKAKNIGSEPLLVNVKSHYEAAALATAGSYGYSSLFGYFPENSGPIFTGAVTAGDPPAFLMPCFVIPNKKLSCGFYINSINGRYVYPRGWGGWTRQGIKFMRNNLASDFISDGKEFSYTTEFSVLGSDSPLAWYKNYQHKKEYADLMADQQDPGWISEVRYAMDCGPKDLFGGRSLAEGQKPFLRPSLVNYLAQRRWLADVEDGGTAIYTLFNWAGVGTLPTTGSWTETENTPNLMNPERVRWCINLFKNIGIKTALYSWNRSYDLSIKDYADHPEWQALNSEGKNQRSFFYGLTKHFPLDAKPDYLVGGFRKYYLGQLASAIKTYGVDFCYIDAEVGDGYADWNNAVYFQPYDRLDFIRDYKKASGSELPLLKNTPNQPYASLYYWEGRGLKSSGMKQNWRNVGGKLLTEKIWQQHGRRTALLKMGTGHDNQPYYANYLIGLGFIAQGVAKPLVQYPYIKASWRMRNLQIAGGEYNPCFWKNKDTDFEVYKLKLGDMVVFSCISHSQKAEDLSIEFEKLWFTPDKKLYVWQSDLIDPRTELTPEMQKLVESAGKEFPDSKILLPLKNRKIFKSRFVAAINNNELNSLKLHLNPELLSMVFITEEKSVSLTANGLVTNEKTDSQLNCNL